MITQKDLQPLQFNGSTLDLKFPFDSVRTQTIHDVLKTRNDLAARLERLISEPRVEGHPIVEWIFNWLGYRLDSPEELLVVSQALARIAALWAPFCAADEEAKALMYASKHPHKMALAFGDFSPAPNDIELISDPNGK